MRPEVATYILVPSGYGNEMVLTTPCHRGARLARTLARRVARSGGAYRYYFTPERAEKWRVLFEGGWHAWRGGYVRERRPVELAEAVRVTRRGEPNIPQSGTGEARSL